MSRKKFWAYLKNEEGQPIPSASIAFKLNDTGQLAQLYSTSVSASNDEIDQSTLTTDVSGFFEFFIGDVYETGAKIGYDPDQLFKLEWISVDGKRAGVIDDMQIFYQIFPVDVTDSHNTIKNKLASNAQTYAWETHRQQTWYHEVHDITALDWKTNKNDSTYSKVVSNKEMNYLQSRLDSLKTSGADSLTIESSACVSIDFNIPSGSWSIDPSGGDLYYYDAYHNFDTQYPLIQLWCSNLSCMQFPAKVEYRDNDFTRIFVPYDQRDGKHIIAISEISKIPIAQNPIFNIENTLTMNVTQLTSSIEIDALPELAVFTLKTEPLSASVMFGIQPSAGYHKLTITTHSVSLSGDVVPSYIPSGGIMFLNDDPNNVPSGWSLYGGSINYGNIRGSASDSNPATEDIAGSYTITPPTLSTAGLHTGNIDNPYPTNIGFPYVRVSSTYSSGDHSHTMLPFDWHPSFARFVLIKANENHSSAPAKSFVLGTGEHTFNGLSNLTGYSGHILGGDNTQSPNSSASNSNISIDGSSAGSHTHINIATGGYYVTLAVIGYASTGNHSAVVDIALTPNIKRKLLSAWTHASQNFNLVNGMIIMWESWIPPIGWNICDGTNGTVDLRDYFIEICDDGSENIAGLGNDTIDIVATTTHSNVHNHRYNQISSSYVTNVYHQSYNASHTHTGSVSRNYNIEHRTFVFIQKI